MNVPVARIYFPRDDRREILKQIIYPGAGG